MIILKSMSNTIFESRKTTPNSGFTLIEILIVIAILGILATVIFLIVGNDKIVEARDTKQKGDLGAIVKAVQSYSLQFGQYPDNLVNLESGTEHPIGKPPSSVSDQLGDSYGFKKNGEDIRIWGFLEQGKVYYVWDSICPQFFTTTDDPADDAFDCSAQLAGEEIPEEPPPGTTFKVSGYIDAQGRSNDSGVTLIFRKGSETYSVTTASWGHYEMNIPSGIYTVTADMNLYLSTERVVSVTAETVIPNGLVKGGDANDDGTINTVDTGIIGASYGKRCGDSEFDSRADINKDCKVDILDLVLAGGNFGLTQPTPW